MSRSRTVYRPRRKKRSFLALPDSAQAFLARRFLDIFALTLGAAGSMLLLALASYDHNDPSANTAGTGPIQNWMGAPGAWLADLSFQTIGQNRLACNVFAEDEREFCCAGFVCARGEKLLHVNDLAFLVRQLDADDVAAWYCGAAHGDGGHRAGDVVGEGNNTAGFCAGGGFQFV